MTKQSGPEGKVVHKVLITQGLDIEKEYYLSITVDNEHSCLVIIASVRAAPKSKRWPFPIRN